jgi:hypothetical protein
MRKFAPALSAAILALTACAKPAETAAEVEPAASASAAPPSVADAEANVPAYEPMAVFAPFVGKTFRGEWTDPDGAKFVDIAKYEMILNGRALQSTHRLEGKDYGGRTIFFYDEGAKNYVFHYFTTAGFHTTGVSEFIDGGLVTEEKVEGHDTIGSVRSKAAFKPDEILVDVVYVGKDGSESPGGSRTYKPIADPGRLFPDTE